MIHFRKLILHNFFTYYKFELNFRNGLYLITGINKDQLAIDNNGVGKTLLADAISWCLFGKTIRGFEKDEVIGKFNKYCLANIWLGIDGQAYYIKRERIKNKSKLYLNKNGKNIDKKDIKDTQDLINKIIGIDFVTFKNTILIGQGDNNKFVNFGDADRSSFLQSVIDVEKYENGFEKARIYRIKNHFKKLKAVSELEKLKISIKNKRELYKEKRIGITKTDNVIKELIKLSDYKYKDYEKDKFKSRIIKFKRIVEFCGVNIKETLKLLEKEKKILKIIDGKETDVNIIMTRKGNDIFHLKDDIKKYERYKKDKTCIECEQEVGIKFIKKKIVKLNNKIKLKEDKLKDIAKRKTLLSKKIKKVDALIYNFELQIKTFEEKQKSALEKIGDINKLLVNINITKKKYDTKKMKKDLGFLYAAIRSLQMMIEDKDKELDKISLNLKKYDFWMQGFKSIIKRILSETVPYINTIANKFASILMDGDIELKFKAETELKSGVVREKTSVDCRLKGETDYRSIKTLSGGEYRRATICFDLAMHNLICNRSKQSFDLLFLDEIFDALDNTGKQRAVQLINQMQKEIPKIYVITHDDNLKDSFTNIIEIVKKDGESKIHG